YTEAVSGTTGGRIRTLLGNGDGTFRERVFTSNVGFFPDMRRVKLADLNGDGLADLVHLAASGWAHYSIDAPPDISSNLSMDAFLSDGNGGWRYKHLDTVRASSNPDDKALFDDTNLVRLIDVDGDGRSDVVHLSTYFDEANGN